MQRKKWLPALLMTLLMLLPMGALALVNAPVPSAVRIRAAATAKPAKTPKPTKTPRPTKTPKPTKVPKVTATPKPTIRPVDFPTLPPVNEKGFLQEGEFVYESVEEGLWMYASPTLKVQIERVNDPNKVLVWYEAHIWSDIEAGEKFAAIPIDREKWGKARHVEPERIAAENKVVFGMNTDYYTYRTAREGTLMVGIIIRDGQIISEKTSVYPRFRFPTLDTLALLPDGSMKVYRSDELTAQQYLDMGAKDVFAFGPILVRDGKTNPDVLEFGYGKTPQPRCAIGMIEPGHYYAVLVEARLKKESVGVSVSELMDMMLAGGCQTALNLDGGQTAVMLFMGKQVTRIGSYAGGKTSPRSTTEIIGIGRSEQVPAWEEK